MADKEAKIIHKKFISERECRITHQESESRLRNINNLMDMGLSLTRFSPIPTIGDTAPQTPVGSGMTTPIPTSTPQPSGRSRLHSSDPTADIKYVPEGNIQNSFSDIRGQVGFQNPTKTQMASTGIPSQTGNNSMFYPGEVPFRNQGTSTSPISMVSTETVPQQTTNKVGKVKRSQNVQINTQP